MVSGVPEITKASQLRLLASGDKFAFVVRIEDVDLGDRAGQVRAEDGVEEMDERVTVVPSRALKTQSVLGSIGWSMRRV